MGSPTQNIAGSLEVLSRRYEVIANNLANSATPAFKRQRVRFEQVLNEATGQAEVQGRVGVDFTQGTFTQTDRPLDFALDGKGFFVLETPQGKLYTRTGTFSVNANRQLIDARGQLVAGEGGPIVLPPQCSPSDVRISPDGAVQAGGTEIGKIRIVDFADPSLLTPVGAGAFRASPAATEGPSTARVHQGYRESSNVNTIQELVDLIQVTRMYEANIKNIAAGDERTKSLLQVAMS